jgi:hypothetical protein
MKEQGLVECSYDALLAGAARVSPLVRYERRYATSWKDNLMPGLPLLEIERDLRSGAGRELDGKLCAAHSSAALAVNTFGAWRTAPDSLAFAPNSGYLITPTSTRSILFIF